MNTILILGAGHCQVPLIRKAKARGLRTVAASAAGDYPGFGVADVAIPIDVRDRNGILQAAIAHRVVGVVTNQTDASVVTAAFVAEKLGLPGIGVDCAERFTNKLFMREVARHCGAATVRCVRVRSVEEVRAAAVDIGFPLVVKPTASQGSRGVSLVHAAGQLECAWRAARQYAPVGDVLVEQYVAGREVTMDGVLVNGTYQHFPLGDVTLFPMPGTFIPQSIVYPSALSKRLSELVLHINERIVRALRLPFGLTHAEYRVREDTGDVALLEIAARGGGMFISSDLVPLVCGIDPEDMLLRLALGLPVHVEPWRYQRASGFHCLDVPSGCVNGIHGIEGALSMPGVVRLERPLRVGDCVQPLSDKTSRRMVFLLDGPSRQEIERTIDRVKHTVTVRCSRGQ